MATQLGNLENQSTQVVKPMPKSINKQLLKEIPSLEKAYSRENEGPAEKFKAVNSGTASVSVLLRTASPRKEEEQKEILKNETEVQFTPPFGHG